MGHLKALLALLTAGLVCAVLVPAASARETGPTHEFIGTVSSEIIVLPAEQELDFGQVVIHCKSVKPVKTKTKTAFPALAILVKINFVKCKTGVTEVSHRHIPASKATFGGPLEIEYLAGGEPDAKIVNSAAVPITFGEGLTGCTVSISATDPTDQVTYTNTEVPAKNHKFFPTGVQEVLSIANSFEAITYTIGGGPCEGFKKGGNKEGEYFGTLLTGLKTGELSWE